MPANSIYFKAEDTFISRLKRSYSGATGQPIKLGPCAPVISPSSMAQMSQRAINTPLYTSRINNMLVSRFGDNPQQKNWIGGQANTGPIDETEVIIHFIFTGLTVEVCMPLS
tara:strand:- start:408 stop:743 length:336 start_codon:yes stop_codon:yes gene_type:complete